MINEKKLKKKKTAKHVWGMFAIYNLALSLEIKEYNVGVVVVVLEKHKACTGRLLENLNLTILPRTLYLYCKSDK